MTLEKGTKKKKKIVILEKIKMNENSSCFGLGYSTSPRLITPRPGVSLSSLVQPFPPFHNCHMKTKHQKPCPSLCFPTPTVSSCLHLQTKDNLNISNSIKKDTPRRRRRSFIVSYSIFSLLSFLCMFVKPDKTKMCLLRRLLFSLPIWVLGFSFFSVAVVTKSEESSFVFVSDTSQEIPISQASPRMGAQSPGNS